jgi:hypothetical protein
MKQVANRGLIDACFLLGLLFHSEDEGEVFFRKVGLLLQYYTAL